MLPEPIFVVYLAQGPTPLGPIRFYVGCTAVLEGETVKEALERRRSQHRGGVKSGGAIWLALCLSINPLQQLGNVVTGRRAAALHELACFLEIFGEKGFKVRGACYAMKTLGPAHVREIKDLCKLEKAAYENVEESSNPRVFRIWNFSEVLQRCLTKWTLQPPTQIKDQFSILFGISSLIGISIILIIIFANNFQPRRQ